MMRLINDSLTGRRPLRYFETLDASIPISFASRDCDRPRSDMMWRMRPMISLSLVEGVVSVII